MEKRFNKSKIIIFSIAILVALLTFSIGIFGIIETNKKEKESQAADTHNYLLKKDTYYDLSWSGFNLKVIMTDAYKITYRKYNTEKQWYDSILIINFRSSATLLADGTKYGDYNVGGYYDITNTTFSSCEVINNDGLSLFNAFKSNESAVIPCRHTLTGTWLGAGWADKDEQINYSKFSITQYHLNGTIDISVDGITYNKSYHWAMGLTYTRANKEILTCGQYNNYIYTNEGLKLFAYELADEVCLNNDSFIYAKMYLADDLDMSSISNMKPIGTSSRPFCGTFNGNGYTVSNLPLLRYANSNSYYYGLFGCVKNANIMDLHLNISDWTDSGINAYNGLYSGLIVAKSTGTTNIDNCLVIGSSFSIISNYSGESKSGSIVGECESVNIKNCAVNINLSITREYNDKDNVKTYLGGLVGKCTGNISIENSYFNGDIYASTYYMLNYGGLVGNVSGSADIKNNFININSITLINRAYVYYMSYQSVMRSEAVSNINIFSNKLNNTNYYFITSKNISCKNGSYSEFGGPDPLTDFQSYSYASNKKII